MLAKLQTCIQQCHVFFCFFFLPRWIPQLKNEDCLLRGEDKRRSSGAWSCSVTAAMPSGRRFEEDTWDQCTWTMSWGVTLNWDEPLFIPHALLLLFFPISLFSPLHTFMPSLVPELIFSPQPDLSLRVTLPIFWLTPSLPGSVSLSSNACPPSGHRHANASGSLSVSMSHIITYLTISTHTFFSEIHRLGRKAGPTLSQDIPAFAIFTQTIYSKLGDWHFVQQLTAASSCMTQWHRSSPHVTMESQRYGVVAKAPLSNTHLIPHRYCCRRTGRREAEEMRTGACVFGSQMWSNRARLKRRTEDHFNQSSGRMCLSYTLLCRRFL